MVYAQQSRPTGHIADGRHNSSPARQRRMILRRCCSQADHTSNIVLIYAAPTDSAVVIDRAVCDGRLCLGRPGTGAVAGHPAHPGGLGH